jgi:hypothetical protein
MAAAAVVNAFAESSLNPKAIDASGTCVGLFQLHERGAGHGLTVEQRQDPTTNARRILRVLDGYQGEPVRAALAAGVRDVAALAGLFCRHVERPARVDLAVAKREALARTLFPTLFEPPAPGTGFAGASLADRAVGLSAEKCEMVRVIEREFLAAGLPVGLAAAAVVNAYAESGLNPRAVGDGGASVGLFQLHERGAGAGMTTAQRMDPVHNTRRIAAVLLGPQGAPVRAAWDAGERGLGRLAALFSTHVERPAARLAEEARRAALAVRLFPGLVLERLPAPVKAGAAAVPVFLLAAGLGGAVLALRAWR